MQGASCNNYTLNQNNGPDAVTRHDPLGSDDIEIDSSDLSVDSPMKLTSMTSTLSIESSSCQE